MAQQYAESCPRQGADFVHVLDSHAGESWGFSGTSEHTRSQRDSRHRWTFFFFNSVCTELNATWNKLFRRWPHRDVTDIVLFILYLRIRCVTVYCTETRILLVMKIKTFLKTYFLVTWLPKVLLNSHGLICYILWSGINTINTVLTENGFNCYVI